MDNGAYAFQGTDPVSEGFGYKADTLEDLAAQANLPVEEFVETVTVWNTYCGERQGPLFLSTAQQPDSH